MGSPWFELPMERAGAAEGSRKPGHSRTQFDNRVTAGSPTHPKGAGIAGPSWNANACCPSLKQGAGRVDKTVSEKRPDHAAGKQFFRERVQAACRAPGAGHQEPAHDGGRGGEPVRTAETTWR